MGIAFAFLDFRVTHDEIVRQGSTRASALVLSQEHAFGIHQSCQTVTDDHPSHYVRRRGGLFHSLSIRIRASRPRGAGLRSCHRMTLGTSAARSLAGG